jgi:hypothetical protein
MTSLKSLLLFVTSVNATAATLKPETIAAWEKFIQTVSEVSLERAQPGHTFLWTFEDPARAAKVVNGEMLAAPASAQNPTKVPGGLIHHWVGAMFVPGVQLDELIQITRDYDRYKEFYGPSVVASKTVAHDGADDRFSMMLLNHVFFSKRALDADFQLTSVRVDQRRCYTISRSTRVQEIDAYGQPGEHRVPEGEGGGYIWKLWNVSRFQQRDGGVYVEMETVALSRDIPGAIALVANPIVRRVSRNSLLISLKQTQAAVRGNAPGAQQSAQTLPATKTEKLSR